MNATVLITFALFVGLTLAITHWAARRTSSRRQFYAADGSITAVQNGLAFAGEGISAATFLGITGLYFTAGYDGLIYSIGALMGWPVILFLMSERMRELGRYTLTDVLAARGDSKALRLFSALATISIVTVYMVAQLVGAGGLISLLLGFDFTVAVSLTGALMIVYVIFGGMVATTWVQIVKACFLIGVGIAMSVMVLARFDFNFANVLRAAIANHPQHAAIMAPSSLITGFGSALSAAMTQAVGLAGLPHFLMRFNTVPNAVEARRSANFATLFIGFFYVLMIFIGFGAIALLSGDPTYLASPGVLRNGNNMAPLYLAQVLGGDLFLAIAASAAFATILAVVAGLTLAVAATISHDIFGTFMRGGKPSEREEIRVSRITAAVFGVITIALSVAFKNENITFLVVTALSIAASATFPPLFLACFWRALTPTAAWVGGACGLVCSVVAIVLGPMVWVSVLGHADPIFPFQYPTIISLPLAMLVTVGVTMLTRGGTSQPAGSLDRAVG